MKKLSFISLFSVLLIFSINVNAAPLLTWDSTATPHFNGGGTSQLEGGHVTLFNSSFTHPWAFTADDDFDLTIRLLTTDSMRITGVSLMGSSLGGSVPLMASSLGSRGFLGPISLWKGAFTNLVQGDQYTLAIVSDGFDNSGVFGGYAFTMTASDASPISATPIPAAVWLFGSALLGVSGLASRRKTVAFD